MQVAIFLMVLEQVNEDVAAKPYLCLSFFIEKIISFSIKDDCATSQTNKHADMGTIIRNAW